MIELSITVPTWTIYVLLGMVAVEIVFSVIKIRLVREQIRLMKDEWK